MPIVLVKSHLAMHDRQDAEDAIAAMNAAAAGFGGASDEHIRQLEQRARGVTTPEPRRYASPIDVARRIGAPVKVGRD